MLNLEDSISLTWSTYPFQFQYKNQYWFVSPIKMLKREILNTTQPSPCNNQPRKEYDWPADIEPTNVSRNLRINMKKFDPDDARLFTKVIVLHPKNTGWFKTEFLIILNMQRSIAETLHTYTRIWPSTNCATFKTSSSSSEFSLV